MVKCGVGGVLIGMALGPFGTYHTMKKEDEYKI